MLAVLVRLTLLKAKNKVFCGTLYSGTQRTHRIKVHL